VVWWWVMKKKYNRQKKQKQQKQPTIVDQSITRLTKLSATLPDKRTGKNIQYQMADIVKGVFAVFFTQSPSFLAHQKALEKSKGRSNAESVFQIEKIPCDEHIRQMIDPVTPSHFYPEFHAIFQQMDAQGQLQAYRVLAGQYILISMDGTEYFTSYEISCPHCLQRQRNNGRLQYYHTAILPVVVAPNNPHVLSLPPEFITPQDGHEKQDCERAAGKRWLTQHASHYAPLGGILLGDDLYANQPFCQQSLDHDLHFLFVCKPDSHPTLYQWVEACQVETFTIRKWNGKYSELWTYRFLNQIPLRAGEGALLVNWCDLHITHKDTGETLYHNSWVTDLTINQSNVAEIVDCGRARWKGENENNNVLKTKGYHLEHNFGHGEHYLAMTLITLNLLAFLLHTVSHLVDKVYRLVREELGRRDTFFNDVRALTRYLLFDSWSHLLQFMYVQLEIEPILDG
jgi:hypothetical protein